MEDDLCVRFKFNDYQHYKYIRPDKRFGYWDQNESVTSIIIYGSYYYYVTIISIPHSSKERS